MARYALNLPVQLKRDAERLAAEQGVSLNQFILWAIAEKVGSLAAMLDDNAYPRITYRRGASGVPQATLRESGIRVQTIVIAADSWSMSPQEIAAEYDLPVGQVNEALAFYDAHRPEIDTHIQFEQSLEDAARSPQAASRRRYVSQGNRAGAP